MRIAPVLVLAAMLVLAACGTDTADTDPPTDVPDEQLEPDQLDDEAASPDPLAPDSPELDLPDPNDLVTDGVFRGEGLVVPAPDGWTFDDTALVQGIVAATDAAGEQQLAGQVIDTTDMGEEMTLDALLQTNRDQIEDTPSVDEAIEVEGATAAHQLRYDALSAQVEGQPDMGVLLIVADDGEGNLAIFNYVATVDAFDDANADLLVNTAAFDPDSEPSTPAPSPDVPAPEDAPLPQDTAPQDPPELELDGQPEDGGDDLTNDADPTGDLDLPDDQ